MTQLNVQDLSVWYGDHRVLNRIGFSLPKNRITSLLGPSGSGKSTLLMSLAGLVRGVPGVRLQGTVQWRDHSPRSIELDPLGSRGDAFGVVFQKPMPFPISIFDNVALALKERRVPKLEIQDRVEDALRRANLWKEVHFRLRESALRLSGGQQQRLCLARSLVLEPEVLYLDEPCSSLDPLSTQTVEQTISEISQGTTVLIVTHNLAQARRLSDKVMLLWNEGDGGRLIRAGSPKEVFCEDRNEHASDYLMGRLG